MWTMDNTDGLTQAELDMINDARCVLLTWFSGDPKTVDDVLNNAWVRGISRDELARAAKRRLEIQMIKDAR